MTTLVWLEEAVWAKTGQLPSSRHVIDLLNELQKRPVSLGMLVVYTLLKKFLFTDSTKSLTNFMTAERPPCLKQINNEGGVANLGDTPCVCISNNRPEVIYMFHFCALFW